MRFTRAGKSTHQRVPQEATSWDELKATPAKKPRNQPADGSIVKGDGKVGKFNNEKFKGDKNGKGDKFSNGKFRGDRNGKFGGDKNGKFRGDRNGKGQKFRRHREEPESANFVELGPRVKPAEESNENDTEGDGNSRKKKKNLDFGGTKQVKFLGQFWVPLDEAKRLKALQKKLKEEGLSKKEIDTALKNERRKAEKSARRARDKTCFNCRQFGHLLQECPKRKAEGELGEGEDSGDICFKCGSTEHISRNCKKSADKFDFAKCFICSKSGHIARQCPENSKGIYPSGGACNECGELTHLAKDCPTLMPAPKLKKEEEAIISRISNPFTSPEFEEWQFETEEAPKESEVGLKKNLQEVSQPIAKKRKVKF